MGLRSCWDSWQRTGQFLLYRPRRRVYVQGKWYSQSFRKPFRRRTEGVTVKPAAATYLAVVGEPSNPMVHHRAMHGYRTKRYAWVAGNCEGSPAAVSVGDWIDRAVEAREHKPANALPGWPAATIRGARRAWALALRCHPGTLSPPLVGRHAPEQPDGAGRREDTGRGSLFLLRRSWVDMKQPTGPSHLRSE
jgi:hypothetical protein